jgi:hypothetical protein
VLRVVVRENFSRDMADMLADDLRRTVEHLDQTGPAHAGTTHARPGPSRLAAAAPARAHAKTHKAARGVC